MSYQGTGALSASRLANLAAGAIAAAFDAYQDGFEAITRRALERFERRDWRGALADAVERLDLYGELIDRIERDMREALESRITDRLLWAGLKAVYSGLIAGREDWELAETFFNSVTRRIFATAGVDPNIEFVASDFEAPPVSSDGTVCRTYEARAGTADFLEAILTDRWFDAPYEDVRRDARLAAARLTEHLRSLGVGDGDIDRAEMVEAPFFRRKGAYLIGRVFHGSKALPLALALLHNESGIAVDAVLVEENDLSILFSFTRSHFHVNAGPPYQLVRFLKRLIPNKRIAELYIAIGCHKHGKTELYRNLLQYVSSTDERFVVAPGTPGLVMVVFTMPGYDVVFKVIKDRFPLAKSVTRNGVMRNYRLVFRHDRAGRLVEAQEFEHLRFDRDRLTADLVEELRREAGRTVEVSRDSVVIHHAYVERRVSPLDLFVREASEDAARDAVIDFGQAIKDLAATNIFPGDLLPKNFGVTRHGRVVCYDYDELSLLTDFQFRTLPVSRTYEDDLAEEGWFGAGPRDAFPEEFPNFISLPPPLREVLERKHGELYDPGFWTQMQDRVQSGEIVDIFPYHPSRRLQFEPF
ncbi:MAG TPA: bifunctional isocitrate dehydrogenase kinase/phosphatase [Actinomycetota bacterium]|jgi:isocitrate dehydrogenase kinase/phosphatase